ncbi:MAG: hypothetical protein KDK70_08580 [Myxococcales bacterium]|nr:hypothetical protein [Myxococcales bacterium]
MPRQALLLALVSLVVACDPMTEPQPEPETLTVDFRRGEDGECADFSTVTVSTTYQKNGYPPPYPYYEAGMAFTEMPEDWQAAFEHDVVDRTATILEAIYLSRASTPEECTSICAELDLGWSGGACAIDVVVGRSVPEAAPDGFDKSPIWRTDVEASGQVGCRCD